KRVTGDHKEIENEVAILVHLRSAGLPVAEPLAFATRPPTSALVTRAMPVVTTLERRILDSHAGLVFAQPLAELVRQLHDAGVNHRDLYLGHVLVATDDALWLVDLGRAEHRRRVPRHRIVKDLAALDFSTPSRIASDAARLRFLYRYLGASASHRRIVSLARAVRRKSKKMRRHAERKIARGEPNVHVNTCPSRPRRGERGRCEPIDARCHLPSPRAM
ncbi:MAG: hypothetical protein HRU14_09820, partial [Planctomycetes bacterium]|nr:hypothetical protein [Planctomycetota bacterium]